MMYLPYGKSIYRIAQGSKSRSVGGGGERIPLWAYEK